MPLSGTGFPLLAPNGTSAAPSYGFANGGGLYRDGLNFRDDLKLVREAANALAMSNSTAGQTFRFYNTTDGTNYERGFVRWNANAFELGTEKGGTGSARAFGFVTDGTMRWYIGSTSGHMLPLAGNTYDIAASGTPIRTLYAGTSVVAPYVRTTATTVAALPAAGTAGAGARAFVTDANATTFLSTVAAGGANAVPVVSDGTNWLIG